VACASTSTPPARRCSTCHHLPGAGHLALGPAHGDRAAPGAAAGLSHGGRARVRRAFKFSGRIAYCSAPTDPGSTRYEIGVAFADMDDAGPRPAREVHRVALAPGRNDDAGPGPAARRSSWPGRPRLPRGAAWNRSRFPPAWPPSRDLMQEELIHAETVVARPAAAARDPKLHLRPGHRGPSTPAARGPRRIEAEIRASSPPPNSPPSSWRALPADTSTLREHGCSTCRIPTWSPGGRFNEMYGWGQLLIQVGLLRDGELGRGAGHGGQFRLRDRETTARS